MSDLQTKLNTLIELGDEIESSSSEIAQAIGNGVWAEEAKEAGWVTGLIESIEKLQTERDALEAKAMAILRNLN